MEQSLFEKFRAIVYERSGIALKEGKESLVSARVGKRMRTLGIADHQGYFDYLMRDETGEEFIHLIDAISTNVTSFFRESAHFDFVTQKIGRWLDEGATRFRFWSAASSTGEEPYTLAMTLQEAVGQRALDVKILATDISTRVLQHCERGAYEERRLDTVPAALRQRYFDRCRDGQEPQYAVKDCLKKLITFRRLNLSQPPFPMKGPFDIIFCRNVMIYFDNDVRKKLLAELHRVLKPGGYLMVGHAESLTGMVSNFKMVSPSIYIR